MFVGVCDSSSVFPRGAVNFAWHQKAENALPGRMDEDEAKQRAAENHMAWKLVKAMVST